MSSSKNIAFLPPAGKNLEHAAQNATTFIALLDQRIAFIKEHLESLLKLREQAAAKEIPTIGATDAIETILLEVQIQFKVTREEIFGRRKTESIVQARQRAMARIHLATKKGPSEIGRLFGRDHATVIHALEREGVSGR